MKYKKIGYRVKQIELNVIPVLQEVFTLFVGSGYEIASPLYLCFRLRSETLRSCSFPAAEEEKEYEE